MGRQCVNEVLHTKPESIQKLFFFKKQDCLVEKAQNLNIPVQFVSKRDLSSMVESDSHQGIVAHLRERRYLDLKDFLTSPFEKSLVVMCDNITDPHNFGAILRASACFGVNAVIFSKNRGVGITPVVSKVGVGATELVPLLQVSNLAETLRQFQRVGYRVITADIGRHSHSIESFTFPQKSLLILGSEHRGVQPLLKRSADMSINIPLLGQIDSLNVSQAAAVLLFTARSKKMNG